MGCSLTLSFDQMTVRAARIRFARGDAGTRAVVSSGSCTAGVGGGAGAIIGGIIGGLKGAVLGAVIGAGGAIAATEGKDVSLPAGAIVRIRLDQAVNVR